MKLSLRVPPQDIGAERSVLGSCLNYTDALVKAISDLSESTFYSTQHKMIFSAIQNVFSSEKTVDIISVIDHLRKNDCLDKCGSESYIAELVDNIATSKNIDNHCEILLRKEELRNIINVCNNTINQAYDSDPGNVLDDIEYKLIKLSRKEKFLPEKVKEILPRVFDEFEKQIKTDTTPSIKSGFKNLDNLTTGFHPGEMIVIAGRPGTGKTALAMNFALNTKNSVLVFSLEMSKSELVKRMLSSVSNVPINAMRGKLSKRDLHTIGAMAGEIYEKKIIIDDSPSLTTTQMRSKAIMVNMKQKVDMIIIDYLQLMQSGTKVSNRREEVGYISRSIKRLARELSCPVIALSQLNRELEKRVGDKRPKLSDLKESGDIEQDSDLVMLLYNDEMYDKKTENPGITEVWIGKQRNGPANCKVDLKWKGNTTTFFEKEDEINDCDDFFDGTERF